MECREGGEAVREGEVPGLGLEKQPPMVNGLRSGLAGGSADGRLSGCPAVQGLRCPLQDWTPCGPQRRWSCHASWTALGPAVRGDIGAGVDTDEGVGRVRGIFGGGGDGSTERVPTWGAQNSDVGTLKHLSPFEVSRQRNLTVPLSRVLVSVTLYVADSCRDLTPDFPFLPKRDSGTLHFPRKVVQVCTKP